MLVPNPVIAPGTRARPLLPTNEMTGMSTFGAWVRFSMSRRPRPTESAVESRLIACAQAASAVAWVWPDPPHAEPTFPAVHVPPDAFEHTPGALVTERPEFGEYQSVKLVLPV